MQTYLPAVKSSLRYTIQEIVPEDALVAIVTVSNRSVVHHDLVAVATRTRHSLILAVETIETERGTCLTCGLAEAIKVTASIT